MLDIKFIRENKAIIEEAAKKRGSKFEVNNLIRADNERKNMIALVEEKRKNQNKYNEKIASADGGDRKKMIETMKELKVELHSDEEKLKRAESKWKKLMLEVPNIPDVSVPAGKDESGNKEVRTWGEKTNFDFKPKNHIELMESLNLLDLERGVKVAGFRGYFLRGDAALLQIAIEKFVFDQIVSKGFEPFVAPSLIRPENFLATGHFPKGKDEVFKTQDELYLAGTAEVPMMGFHRNETLKEEELPKKYVALSQCFRKEAGSYGKDTKGIKRVHEFRKVEQFILCPASHEESVKHHEELTKNSEEIMQKLELPHRVVINASGDISQGAVKTYDIEAWAPSAEVFMETHSSSYYHDFQSRRANIKYKGKDGKSKYVHSLNNTAIATPRILIPILENNQQKDGSVKVPKALREYLGKEIISK